MSIWSSVFSGLTIKASKCLLSFSIVCNLTTYRLKKLTIYQRTILRRLPFREIYSKIYFIKICRKIAAKKRVIKHFSIRLLSFKIIAVTSLKKINRSNSRTRFQKNNSFYTMIRLVFRGKKQDHDLNSETSSERYSPTTSDQSDKPILKYHTTCSCIELPSLYLK